MAIVRPDQSSGGGGSGTVKSVKATDTSIVVAGTATDPTIATGTLDVIAADHPPAADWSNNAHKITSLANGTAASDAAAFGQIPVAMASGRVVRTSGDFSTASTTFVDMTGMSVTITTGARRCLVAVTAVTDHSNNAGQYVNLDVAIDGTRQGGSSGLVGNQHSSNATGSEDHNGSFTYLTDVLTAGSHTFKIQVRVTAGTGVVYAGAAFPCTLGVVELFT